MQFKLNYITTKKRKIEMSRLPKAAYNSMPQIKKRFSKTTHSSLFPVPCPVGSHLKVIYTVG